MALEGETSAVVEALGASAPARCLLSPGLPIQSLLARVPLLIQAQLVGTEAIPFFPLLHLSVVAVARLLAGLVRTAAALVEAQLTDLPMARAPRDKGLLAALLRLPFLVVRVAVEQPLRALTRWLLMAAALRSVVTEALEPRPASRAFRSPTQVAAVAVERKRLVAAAVLAAAVLAAMALRAPQ